MPISYLGSVSTDRYNDTITVMVTGDASARNSEDGSLLARLAARALCEAGEHPVPDGFSAAHGYLFKVTKTKSRLEILEEAIFEHPEPDDVRRDLLAELLDLVDGDQFDEALERALTRNDLEREDEGMSLSEYGRLSALYPDASTIGEAAERAARCPHGRSRASREANPCPNDLPGCEVV